MGNWGDGMDGWGHGGGAPVLMGVWAVLVVIGVALLVALAVRLLTSRNAAPAAAGVAGPGVASSLATPTSGARAILEQRLARGEISADEFRELIGVIEA